MAEPIRYYFDQHMQGAILAGLRQQGVDVLAAQEAERCGLPDHEQLAYATAQQRVMVSYDTDYLALHQAAVEHAGIAWCPATKYRIGQLVQMLVLLHSITDRDSMRNHVEYL